MKEKRAAAVILALLLVLLSLTACQSQKTDQTEGAGTSAAETAGTSAVETTSTAKTGDLYDFENYESSEVFDIEKVSLSEKLAEKCSSYKFTYLSDGLKIKAYISIPNDMAETQKPGKCLMYNHGGNRDYGIMEDDTTAILCSLCGRIVAASQYRGCGGSEGADRFGGDDLNDVIKLIDLCEKQFSFIDMDDFCVLGASRGGVMTYPAARKDSRIKRIIGFSAVTDMFDCYESRDDMKAVIKETLGFTPEENPEEYEKRSAVCWADEIKVPVLFIHSKGDKMVSYKQADELYNKLKDHTGSKFISHDDDNHCVPQSEDIAAMREWLNGGA